MGADARVPPSKKTHIMDEEGVQMPGFPLLKNPT
jgi:hypothetical protein